MKTKTFAINAVQNLSHLACGLLVAATLGATVRAGVGPMYTTPPLVAPVQVIQLPDLSIPSLMVTGWVQNTRDESVRVTFAMSVRNSGRVRCGQFNVRLLMTGIKSACVPATWSRTQEILLVQGLYAGQEIRHTFTITFTGSQARHQTAIYHAVVDSLGQIWESNESNNTTAENEVHLDTIGAACQPGS